MDSLWLTCYTIAYWAGVSMSFGWKRLPESFPILDDNPLLSALRPQGEDEIRMNEGLQPREDAGRIAAQRL